MENVVLFPHLGSASVYTRDADGPARGRQSRGLGGRQAAAHAGAGDAVAAQSPPMIGDVRAFFMTPRAARGSVSAMCPGVVNPWCCMSFSARFFAVIALVAASMPRAHRGRRRRRRATPPRQSSAPGKSPMPIATSAAPVTFSADPAPGGFKLELDPACGDALPELKEVVAWALGPNDAVRLVDNVGAIRARIHRGRERACTKPSARGRACSSCRPRRRSRPRPQTAEAAVRRLEDLARDRQAALHAHALERVERRRQLQDRGQAGLRSGDCGASGCRPGSSTAINCC